VNRTFSVGCLNREHLGDHGAGLGLVVDHEGALSQCRREPAHVPMLLSMSVQNNGTTIVVKWF
jgi:hypothetical protein